MTSSVAVLGSPIFQAFYPGTTSPLVGGLLYTLTPGGSLSQTIASYPTVIDAQNQTNANTNPIVLDANGSAPVVVLGPTKLELQDPTGVQEWSFDNFNLQGSNIYDSNGIPLLLFSGQSNAVNYLTIANAVTGSNPIISATGSDASIGMSINLKSNNNLNLNTGTSGLVNAQGSIADAGSLTVGTGATIGGTATISGNIVTSGSLSVNGPANNIQIVGSNSGSPVLATATGTDNNVLFQINGKGTSGVGIQGSTGGVSSASGNIGEVFTVTVAGGSAISLTSGIGQNIMSLALPTGNWLAVGALLFTSGAGTSVTGMFSAFNNVSNTLPADYYRGNYICPAGINLNSASASVVAQTRYFSNSLGGQTIWLIAAASFSGGTCGAYGTMTIIRMP